MCPKINMIGTVAKFFEKVVKATVHMYLLDTSDK